MLEWEKARMEKKRVFVSTFMEQDSGITMLRSFPENVGLAIRYKYGSNTWKTYTDDWYFKPLHGRIQDALDRNPDKSPDELALIISGILPKHKMYQEA